MINREQVTQVLDAMESISDEDVTLEIYGKGKIHLKVYPKNWWSEGCEWPDEKRHKILALLTPFEGNWVLDKGRRAKEALNDNKTKGETK